MSATEAAGRVFSLWSVDEEWSVPTFHGFTWLPYRLEQSLSFASAGERVVLSAETTIVSNVRDAAAALECVASFCSQAVPFAVFYDPSTAEVRAATVTVMTGYYYATVARFADAALRQITLAERWADGMAQACDGEVARAGHPLSGYRAEPDDMLSMLAIFGDRPEHVLDALDVHEALPVLAERIASALDLPFGEGGLNSNGLDFEFPLIAEDGSQLDVVVLRSQRSGALGPGLTYELWDSSTLDPDQARVLANQANLTSARSRLQLCGAWIVEGGSLGFRAFVPRALLAIAAAISSEETGLEAVDVWLRQSTLEQVPSLLAFREAELEADAQAAGRLEVPCRPLLDLADTFAPDEHVSWLSGYEPDVDLGVWGIFNPVGPTLVQIGLLRARAGCYLFVEWMRHPFSPMYRVLDVVESADPPTIDGLLQTWLTQSRADGTDGLMPGAFPEFVIPAEDHADELAKHLVSLADADEAESLGLAAAHYDYYDGDAWARLSNVGEPPTAPDLDAGGVGLTWWRAVTEQQHVMGHRQAFPSAWDGAIRFLEEAAQHG